MKRHQDIKPPVMVKFVIGTLSLPLANLETEEHTHQNLLFLSSLKDSYHNPTRKVLYTFQWADQHLKFPYLATDDSYVCLNMMTQELSSKFCTGDYTNSKVK